MTERDPISRETGEILRSLGVEAVLYDFDDTLIYTGEIFHYCLHEYGVKVAKETGLNADEILKVVTQIDTEQYKVLGVNPKRWLSVVNKTADIFPEHRTSIELNVEVLLRIYELTPRMRPGASTLLEVIKDLGLKQGLVTHANVEWTNRKLNQLGLWDYFDTVFIADENGHKGKADWKGAMDSLEIAPSSCLVLGDSLSGDIRPCDELGARTMWIPGSWDVTRAGSIPKNTVQIDQITETLAALSRLR